MHYPNPIFQHIYEHGMLAEAIFIHTQAKYSKINFQLFLCINWDFFFLAIVVHNLFGVLKYTFKFTLK